MPWVVIWSRSSPSGPSATLGLRIPAAHEASLELQDQELRRVDVLTDQGRSTKEVVKTIAVTERTYSLRRVEYGVNKNEQVKRLKATEL
jgi:hypothetical protein